MERFLQIRIKNDLNYLHKEHILLSENVDESLKTIIEKLKQSYKGFDFKLNVKETSDKETNFEFVAIESDGEPFIMNVTVTRSMINS